jgi:hypothetical protein
MTLVALMASAWAVTPKDLLAHPPTRYFNDYAQVAQPASTTYLNNILANFERGICNQILAVIFTEWPTEVVFDDFAQGLAVMAAADGEYQGGGKTATEQNAHNHGISGWMALVIFVLLVLLPVSTVILAFRLAHMYRTRRSRGDRTGGGDAGDS